MKSIIEREATFEYNSDIEFKVTQKKLSLAFVKDMLNSQLNLTNQAPIWSP